MSTSTLINSYLILWQPLTLLKQNVLERARTQKFCTSLLKISVLTVNKPRRHHLMFQHSCKKLASYTIKELIIRIIKKALPADNETELTNGIASELKLASILLFDRIKLSDTASDSWLLQCIKLKNINAVILTDESRKTMKIIAQSHK